MVVIIPSYYIYLDDDIVWPAWKHVAESKKLGEDVANLFVRAISDIMT
jgi:hypothetical protein